jgi:hypothetical protein
MQTQPVFDKFYETLNNWNAKIVLNIQERKKNWGLNLFILELPAFVIFLKVVDAARNGMKIFQQINAAEIIVGLLKVIVTGVKYWEKSF